MGCGGMRVTLCFLWPAPSPVLLWLEPAVVGWGRQFQMKDSSHLPPSPSDSSPHTLWAEGRSEPTRTCSHALLPLHRSSPPPCCFPAALCPTPPPLPTPTAPPNTHSMTLGF